MQTNRRQLLPLRGLFLVATALVVIAAVQLFVLTERTDHFFAWTVKPPLSAAADGAFYLAAAFVLAPAARAREWASARAVAAGVLVVATGKLVATLLHSSRFHFDSLDSTAQVAAWGWLVVYVVVPPLLVALLIAQHRVQGSDPPRQAPFPPWFRLISGIQAGAMSLAGCWLFLAPELMSRAWPWMLTPLTSRSIGAWFLGLAAIAWATLLENDFARSRGVMMSSIVVGVLQLTALIRYSGDIQWARPLAWVYPILFASLIGVGLYGGVVGIRRRPAP